MQTAIHRSIVLALTLCFSVAAWSRDLTGQWNLQVEDEAHRVITVLVIEFTDRQASSCNDGAWSLAQVLSATTGNRQFFPVSEPLSDKVENKQLALGHTEPCDGGTLLLGSLDDEVIHGRYLSGARGQRPLGFFTLSKKKGIRQLPASGQTGS